MNKFLSLMTRMAENQNTKNFDPLTFNGWTLDPLTFNSWTRGLPSQRQSLISSEHTPSSEA